MNMIETSTFSTPPEVSEDKDYGIIKKLTRELFFHKNQINDTFILEIR
jgi:hypothetical protein